MNNLIPQMVSTYLHPVFIGLFFILVTGSLSSLINERVGDYDKKAKTPSLPKT